ncbi:hypothetical protein EBR96_01280, partial [bacterium]|nr:hypothetical protein [bacterium]
MAQSTNAGPATSFLDSGLFDTFAIGGSNFGHEPTGTGAILVDHPTRHPSQIPERSASRPRPAWGEQQKPQMQTQAETKAALERRRSESTSRRRYTSAVSPEPTRWASPRKPAVPTQAARVAKHRSPSPTRTTRPHSAPSDRSESRGSMTSMKVRAVSPPMVPPSTRPLTMPSTAITALLSPERILGIPVAALATLIQIPEKIQEAQETSVVTASDIQTLTRELPKLIRLATSAEISYSDEDAPKIRYEEVRDAVLLIKEYTAHLRSPDLSAMLDVEVERLIAHAPLPVAAPPDPLVHSPTRREAIVTAAPARQSNASRITELMAQNLNSPTLEIRKFVSLCQHLNPDEMAQVIDHLRKGTSNEVQISNVLNICVKLSHKSKLDLVEIILTHSAGQRRSVLNSILARKELLPTTNIPQTGIALSTCSILLGALSQSGREGSEAYDSLKTITQGLAYQMGILDSAAITRDTEIAGHASDSGFMNLDTLLANTIPTQTRHQLTQDYQRGLEYGLGLRVDQESRFERESGMRTEQRQLDAFRTDFLTRGTKRAPQLVFRDGESVDSFKARLTSEVRALGNAPNYMAKDDWNQFIQDTVLIINNLLEQETARLTQARASVPSAVPPMSEAAAPPAILSEPPPTAVSRARSEYEI